MQSDVFRPSLIHPGVPAASLPQRPAGARSALQRGVAGPHARVDRGNPKTLIAIDNPHIREGLRNALQAAGFEDLTASASPAHLNEVLAVNVFDLIITMAELAGDFVAPIFARMRDGKLAHHPFPIIVMLATSGEPAFIKQVMNCGPDTVILMPVAPSQLLSHIDALGGSRKAFVVTQEYTGPDRRGSSALRPGTVHIPTLDVPNPLKARREKVPAELWLAAIRQAADTLNTRKVERYAAQIDWVSHTINNSSVGGQTLDSGQLRMILTRLKEIARELTTRTREELLPPKLLQDLSTVVDSVLSVADPAHHRHIGVLTQACLDLAKALRKRLL